MNMEILSFILDLRKCSLYDFQQCVIYAAGKEHVKEIRPLNQERHT